MRFKNLITLLFISQNVGAICVPTLLDTADIESFAVNTSAATSSLCDSIQRPMSRNDARDLLKVIANQQKLELSTLGDAPKRYQIGKKLNRCKANRADQALVINFEGTGSYSPRTADLMNRFARCAGQSDMGKYLHYEAKKVITEVYGNADKWTALQAGPLNQITQHGDLSHTNWLTFPSEETEVLAEPTSVRSYTNLQSNIYPRGVEMALECYNSYMEDAKAKNIKPKIIVQGHSSGGRSVVKFLEVLKSYSPPHKVDLMLTIDPVKEAHLAVGEVFSQVAGNANRAVYNAIPFVDDVEIKPPNVWTRRQPDTLYKPSNTARAVNFYQNVDSEGLKMAVKFGIHGSPIHNADLNLFINEDLSDDAHGLIAKHDKVIEQIVKEYQRVDLLP